MLLRSNRIYNPITTTPFKLDITNIPYLPPKVNPADILQNNKLLPDEEIEQLYQRHFKTGHHHKNAIPCKYVIDAMDDDLFAIYPSNDDETILGAGARGKVKLAMHLRSGE